MAKKYLTDLSDLSNASHVLQSTEEAVAINLMTGPGCEACRFTGFHGRIAIGTLVEILRCSFILATTRLPLKC
ncbi:MAG: hypothetical protein H7240_13145 [Glaciimonas sp.]|nr:hypothetical protein [Glaciimonas sp.]